MAVNLHHVSGVMPPKIDASGLDLALSHILAIGLRCVGVAATLVTHISGPVADLMRSKAFWDLQCGGVRMCQWQHVRVLVFAEAITDLIGCLRGSVLHGKSTYGPSRTELIKFAESSHVINKDENSTLACWHPNSTATREIISTRRRTLQTPG